MRAVAPLLAAVLALSGCASERPPSLALHLALQRERVALVSDTAPIEGAADLFARSRAGGALKGAGLGALMGVGMLGSGSCEGALCGPVLVLGLAFAVVTGTVVGTVAGAVRATPADEARAIDRAVHDAVEGLPAQLDLSQRVREAVEHESGAALEPLAAPAPDAAALRAAGFAHALGVGVRRIEFTGGEGSDPELALEIEAGARILDARTGEVVHERSFTSTGAPRRFSAWVAEDGEPLRRALADGLASLAESMASALFSQADLGISGGTWTFPGTHGYGACWLVPLEPPNEGSFPSLERSWPSVPRARLTLRWEPFPTASGREKLERASGGRLGDVRYDLRLWEVRDGERGPLVYERRGLAEPAHTLEQALAPRQRHFWSARACFEIDGGTACTPWASSLVPSREGRTCESPDIPAANYYRFETR